MFWQEEDDEGWSAGNSQHSLSGISASGSYGAMASAHGGFKLILQFNVQKSNVYIDEQKRVMKLGHQKTALDLQKLLTISPCPIPLNVSEFC